MDQPTCCIRYFYIDIHLWIKKNSSKYIIIIIKVFQHHGFLWFPLLPAIPITITQCPHTTVLQFIGEFCSWVCLYFFSCAQCVLLILFGWFGRWEVSGRTTAILWSMAPWIHSKQRISWWISHPVFLLIYNFLYIVIFHYYWYIDGFFLFNIN